MRKVITLIFAVFIANQYSSQNSSVSQTIDMYPKIPDAAAVSKVADIPAGNYTGVANFSIPIYNIKTKGGNIPIELTYTTSGIKVGEIASRVGLGWSLNVGASLSQQIYGEADNPMGFKKYTINTLENTPPSNCIGGYDPFGNPLCEAFLSAIGVSPGQTVMKADLLPDIFSYQLLDKSGQFIFDFNGEHGIPRPYNQLIINHVRGLSSDAMEIIGENGIKYSFTNTPFELDYFSSCQTGVTPLNVDFTPNYKIKSIEFPNKNIIEYKYLKQINSKFISSISEQENIYNKESTATAPWFTLPPKKCVNKTHSREEILSEINFPDGKILFYYNNDEQGSTGNIRQDLVGDVYLTRVVVKSLSNEIINDISLIYDYFNSPKVNINNYPQEAEEYPDTFKRLKLISVKDNKNQGEYKLSYYGEHTGKSLPNRLSYSQDFWGVYNGQPNSTGIATVKVKRWSSQNIYDIHLGANKEPDFNFGVIGNLEKIQYPNGGYTEVTYESDDYIKNSYVPPVYNYIENFTEEVSLNNTINFVLPEGNNIFNKGIILKDSDCDEEDNPVEAMNGDPIWELKKLTGNPIYSWGWMCTKLVDRPSDVAGTYRLGISKSNGARNNRELKARYYWIKEVIADASETRKTGTIRVKQIENNSLDNGKIIRQYTYLDPETGKSSGKNAGEELFVSLSYNEVPIPPKGVYGYGTFASQLNRVNNPGWQINTVRGKAVGYGYVQEIYTSTSNPLNNFKKQQKFKNDLISYYPYQYLSAVNVDWPTLDLDRGLMQEEMSFDDKGNRIKYMQFDYDNDYYFNQFASMNYFDYPTNVSTPFIAQAAVVKMKTYDLGPAQDKNYHLISNVFNINNMWIKNVKTTTTDYVNDQPSVVTEQTTAYSTNTAQNRHTFPESQSNTIVGSGITSSQNYKYAHDLSSYLKGKNIISIPLETEVKKNGLTISKTETQYPISQTDANIKSSGLPLPLSVSSMDLQSSTTSTEIIYNQYDIKGNPLQYTLKPDINGNNGIPVTIIWGYNQTQPIAKIEGATYAQVSGYITDIVNYSNTDASVGSNVSEQDLIDKLDAFRKKTELSGYQITTYTYDPLIGVRSITPPSGIREYYFYDTANRLESVKTDENGVLTTLKEYQYHYKP